MLAFSLNEGFLGYILCHIFVGMLPILLHLDFNCIFISDLLWVMWKWLYSLLQFLTSQQPGNRICKQCQLGKMTKYNFKSKTHTSKGILEIIHSNLKGILEIIHTNLCRPI